MTDVLFGYVRRDPPDALAQSLLLTQTITGPKAEILTFSGGVSEYIYGREERTFDDIARPLADAVRNGCGSLGLEIVWFLFPMVCFRDKTLESFTAAHLLRRWE